MAPCTARTPRAAAACTRTSTHMHALGLAAPLTPPWLQGGGPHPPGLSARPLWGGQLRAVCQPGQRARRAVSRLGHGRQGGTRCLHATQKRAMTPPHPSAALPTSADATLPLRHPPQPSPTAPTPPFAAGDGQEPATQPPAAPTALGPRGRPVSILGAAGARGQGSGEAAVEAVPAERRAEWAAG